MGNSFLLGQLLDPYLATVGISIVVAIVGLFLLLQEYHNNVKKGVL